ncbi:MAG TPA: hypothetical protein VF243_07395 [Nitrosospira sp.]
MTISVLRLDHLFEIIPYPAYAPAIFSPAVSAPNIVSSVPGITFPWRNVHGRTYLVAHFRYGKPHAKPFVTGFSWVSGEFGH